MMLRIGSSGVVGAAAMATLLLTSLVTKSESRGHGGRAFLQSGDVTRTGRSADVTGRRSRPSGHRFSTPTDELPVTLSAQFKGK